MRLYFKLSLAFLSLCISFFTYASNFEMDAEVEKVKRNGKRYLQVSQSHQLQDDQKVSKVLTKIGHETKQNENRKNNFKGRGYSQ